MGICSRWTHRDSFAYVIRVGVAEDVAFHRTTAQAAAGNSANARGAFCSIGSKQDGAFAQYLLTPALNLQHVPDDLDLESAALTEPLACTVYGVLDLMMPGQDSQSSPRILARLSLRIQWSDCSRRAPNPRCFAGMVGE